ncbi:MAG: drug/metabolite transporter (DMT)-like permease [Planctomycetota bacterium]
MQTDNLKAALAIVIAMAMITSNDAIVKHLTQIFNVGQIIFLRGILACAIFAIALKFKKQPVLSRHSFHRWNLLRGCFEMIATLTFMTSLSLLPLATTSTLGFSSPIFLAIFAAIILREKVSLLRWMIIFAGFGGVLLITNPFNDGSSWAMILPVICAIFVALRDLVVRYLPADLPTMQVAFTNAWIVMLGGGVYSIFQGWNSADWDWYLWFGLIAALIYTGYVLYILGTRIGELSFIAPFKYTSIILALLLGYLIWGDVPTLQMLLGAAIIIGSGVVLLTNERRRIARLNTPQA